MVAKPQKKDTIVSEEEQVVYLGDDKPVVLKQGQRSRGSSESKSKLSRSNSEICNNNNYL